MVTAVNISTRFRRRLTVTFIVVAGVAAGLLGAVSYGIVGQYRHDALVNRSNAQADFAVSIAASASDEEVIPRLIQLANEQGEFIAVGIDEDTAVSSDPRVSAEDISDSVRERLASGSEIQRQVSIGSSAYVLIGRNITGKNSEAYFLFPRSELEAGMKELRNVLLGVWLAVVGASALAGSLVARRTLVPVQAAADAARSLTQGLLDTRLPPSTTDEFGAWTQYFNDLAIELRDKIEALSAAHARERRFTADVAHELRTPLSGMVTAASLLEEHLEALPDEARRPAELVIADISRLRNMVLELLEISRLEANQETLRREPLRLMHVLHAIAVAGRWSERVDFHGVDANLRSDPVRLERIFNNLIGNAIVHGDGRIDVTVSNDGEKATVEVGDRGPGIAPEHMPFIFERFYKASSSRTEAGSGLGLSIALRNAELLGGTITAEPREGGGALFRVVLPLDAPSDRIDSTDWSALSVP